MHEFSHGVVNGAGQQQPIHDVVHQDVPAVLSDGFHQYSQQIDQSQCNDNPDQVGDKLRNDAKASTVALDRLLNFIERNLAPLLQNNLERLWNEALERHPNDPEKRDSLYIGLVKRDRPFTVNLMLHSMVNYILSKPDTQAGAVKQRLT